MRGAATGKTGPSQGLSKDLHPLPTVSLSKNAAKNLDPQSATIMSRKPNE